MSTVGFPFRPRNRVHLSRTFGWVHLPHVLAILAVWLLLCTAFQRGLRWERWSGRIPYLWAAADVVILTVTMLMTDTFVSPIAIGYPLMVAAAGLGLRGGCGEKNLCLDFPGVIAKSFEV